MKRRMKVDEVDRISCGFFCSFFHVCLPYSWGSCRKRSSLPSALSFFQYHYRFMIYRHKLAFFRVVSPSRLPPPLGFYLVTENHAISQLGL